MLELWQRTSYIKMLANLLAIATGLLIAVHEPPAGLNGEAIISILP